MPLNGHIRINLLKSRCCRHHLAEPSLVWLEEQTVHVRQFYFVIVEEDQLQAKNYVRELFRDAHGDSSSMSAPTNSPALLV